LSRRLWHWAEGKVIPREGRVGGARIHHNGLNRVAADSQLGKRQAHSEGGGPRLFVVFRRSDHRGVGQSLPAAEENQAGAERRSITLLRQIRLEEDVQGLLVCEDARDTGVAGVKPLTLHLIDSLYDKFMDSEAHAARSARASAEPANPESEQQPSPDEIQAELETLPDSAIQTLRTKTLRERGRRVMAFDRQMFSRQ